MQSLKLTALLSALALGVAASADAQTVIVVEPAVVSDGQYGVPKGLQFGFPIKSTGSSWEIIVWTPRRHARLVTNREHSVLPVHLLKIRITRELVGAANGASQSPGGAFLNVRAALGCHQHAGDKVVVDGNHPLAGQTLIFSGTVTEVRAATREELRHGHVHGPEGHHH